MVDAALIVQRPGGWAWLPDALDVAACERLAAAFAAGEAREGGLIGGIAASSVRRSRIVRFDDGGELGWAYDAMAGIVAAFNRIFNYRLDGFDEQLQLAGYEARDAGFYDWHVDRGGAGLAARRKLSLTIQLDPPDAYAGGALELNANGQVETAPRERGTAVAFPSFMLHRVAPVTAGTRRALVGWVAGPPFV